MTSGKKPNSAEPSTMKKIQDHYFNKAKKDGYVARSAYKLQEINERHKIIKKNFKVLDLGCYPGSWMQYISKKIGDKGIVVGVDRTQLKMQLLPNTRFVHSDINDLNLNDLSLDFHYDFICSDMAPNSTGIRDVDLARSLDLCEMVLTIAQNHLKKKGTVLMKAFQGSSFDLLKNQVKDAFHQMKIIKPQSSRNESREIFLLGLMKK